MLLAGESRGEKVRMEMEMQNVSNYQSCLMLKTCMYRNINIVHVYSTFFYNSRFEHCFWLMNLHCFIRSLDSDISDLIIAVLCFSTMQGAVTVNQEIV